MNIEKIFKFHQPNLYLNLLERGDLNFTLYCRNHDQNRFWFLTNDIITRTRHALWFNEYKKNENQDHDFVFMIKDSDNIRYGQISLYHLDFKNHICSIGRLFISPDHKGKGIMPLAFQASIEVARSIGIKKLILEVHRENHIAMKIFKSFGFIVVNPFNSNFIKMESHI